MRNHIQERVRSDGAISRIGNCGADEPRRTSVLAVWILLPFRAAAISLKLVRSSSWAVKITGNPSGVKPFALPMFWNTALQVAFVVLGGCVNQK